MAAVKALQQWCRVRCEGYRDVSITNMTTSFKDGLAFCALIHKHRPDLINFESLRKENVYENNKLAFQVAEQELGIPALLDAEDMVALRVPDRLSILTYVSQYYNFFHGRSPIGGMGGIKRPAEGPANEPSGKKNQPVTAKKFPSSQPARENSPPPSPNITRPSPSPRQTKPATQDVVAGKPHQPGTLSNRCVACNEHVHLVQRHLVDGKLYHRNCAKLQSPTNTTAPLRPLLTNTPACRSTPAERPKVNTSPAQTPSRPAEKIGTPSSFSSTFSASAPGRPASGLAPAAKESPTAFVSKPTASQATSGATFTTSTSVATRPSAAARTSTAAERTHQAKLKFLQSENTASNEEKKTTTLNVDVNKWPKVTGKVQEAKAGPAQTVGVNVGVGREEASLSVGDKAKAAGVGAKVGKETNKAKASAAAFLSKKLAEENNNNNKLSRPNAAPTKAETPQSQLEVAKTQTGVNKGRVKLKADPSILADLQPAHKPTEPGARPPDRGGLKPGGTAPSVAAPERESPADWRSKLKPVAKDTKPVGASQSPKPWTGTAGEPQTSELPVGPSAPSAVTPKGLQNGQNNKTTNGSKANVSKAKSDYIPKEDIMKELQEIEENLNELEKRGVELEVRLRKSEEEGEDDSLMDELMVEWFGLIRNKQVAIRRESELNYVAKTQDLEEEQPSVEQELRRLMDKPDRFKTQWDRKREEQLMNKLMEIVNDRNAIVEGLDEDRLREEEEDEELNKMMRNFNIRKDKAKKKSPVAKIFGWGNKKEG